jgi:hypothetical protein
VLDLPELVALLNHRHITIGHANGKLHLKGSPAAFTHEIETATKFWKQHLKWLAYMEGDHTWAACDVCGEYTITSAKNRNGPKCRLTPGCAGRHTRRVTTPPGSTK